LRLQRFDLSQIRDHKANCSPSLRSWIGKGTAPHKNDFGHRVGIAKRVFRGHTTAFLATLRGFRLNFQDKHLVAGDGKKMQFQKRMPALMIFQRTGNVHC
jgi:hypothetical protein